MTTAPFDFTPLLPAGHEARLHAAGLHNKVE